MISGKMTAAGFRKAVTGGQSKEADVIDRATDLSYEFDTDTMMFSCCDMRGCRVEINLAVTFAFETNFLNKK